MKRRCKAAASKTTCKEAARRKTTCKELRPHTCHMSQVDDIHVDVAASLVPA